MSVSVSLSLSADETRALHYDIYSGSSIGHPKEKIATESYSLFKMFPSRLLIQATVLVGLIISGDGFLGVDLQRPLLGYSRKTNDKKAQAAVADSRKNARASTLLQMSSIGNLGKGLRKKKLKPFVRYLEVECWKRAEMRDLEPVLQAVAEACKQINRIVQRAKTDDLYGVATGIDGNPLDGTNIQGEVQQKLDVICNTIMLRTFCGSSKAIHSVASEEEDFPRCCADIMVRTKHGQKAVPSYTASHLMLPFRYLRRMIRPLQSEIISLSLIRLVSYL